mmetsp:Transcript_24240/g.38998  ORF Transcript_24240/g.38998 Transcript_24240/m.38998 type:complete len:124 (-) Transcript_24240:752-1123(-)
MNYHPNQSSSSRRHGSQSQPPYSSRTGGHRVSYSNRDTNVNAEHTTSAQPQPQPQPQPQRQRVQALEQARATAVTLWRIRASMQATVLGNQRRVERALMFVRREMASSYPKRIPVNMSVETVW